MKENNLQSPELLALAVSVAGCLSLAASTPDPWQGEKNNKERRDCSYPASLVEFDLLEFLELGKKPVCFWDTEDGAAEALQDDSLTPEWIAKERAEWEEAHRRLRQKLRLFLKATTPAEPSIDTTGNLCVCDAECDLLDFLREGITPTNHYDTERGEVERRSCPEYTLELEEEYRQQWLEAHRAQAQMLKAYVEHFCGTEG